MNEGVICNGISWQQWRIVCRDVRIVPVDGHYRRTLRFRHTGTSSSRQKTCQPTMIRAAECMPRELLLRWQKATHSNSRPPIELLRMENAAAHPPPQRPHSTPASTPVLHQPLLLTFSSYPTRKKTQLRANESPTFRERERVVGSRGRRRDSKSLAGEKDKERVEEEPRVQGSSLDAVVIPETDGLRQQTPCNLYLPARLPPACNNAPGLKPPPFERGSSQSWDLPRILPAIIINYLGQRDAVSPHFSPLSI